MNHLYRVLRRLCGVSGSPQGARINPIRVKRQHFVIEIARARCRLQRLVEIENVFPCFLNVSRVAIGIEYTVCSDYRTGMQRFDLVECREPFLTGGLSPFVADLLVGLDRVFCDSVLTERTFTVEDLCGAPPRSLSDWLLENLDVFRQ